MTLKMFERFYHPEIRFFLFAEGDGGGASAGGGAGGGGASSSSSTPSGTSGAGSEASGPQPSSLPDSGGTADDTEAAGFDDDDIFAGFNSAGDDEEDTSSPPGAKKVAAPAQPAQTPSPQATLPQPQPQQQPQPAQTPTGQQDGPQREQQTPAGLSLAEPAAVSAALLQNKDVAIEHLSKTMFVLSDDDVAALEADATTAVPKLLARTFVHSQAAMMDFVARSIPQMVERHLGTRESRQRNVDEFYSRWKDHGLDRTKHDATVSRIAKMYRAENPHASKQQMIEDIGPIVLGLLKLPMQSQARPAAQNGTGPRPRARIAQPFTPAAAGARGAAPQNQAAEDNLWDGLGQSFDE